MDKSAVLHRYFGHSAFRIGQEALIDTLLRGKDALGIMPTGAGKSLCYQVPAAMVDGITLVISPLISLMKDQVFSLNQSGLKAAYINSTLSPGQQREVLRRASLGAYRLIYITPERLRLDSFGRFAKNAKIALIAVDEAHCVSQWGQDFRPAYLDIADFIDTLPKRPPVGAFTATATKQVQKDIVRLLRLNKPFLSTQSFDRPNLYFEVRRPKSKADELLRLMRGKEEQCGIIYCSTRKNVDKVCDTLRRTGISTVRYHAGLSEDERKLAQEDFQFDKAKVMVATNAFGMGIDKSNVSYVYHYNMPKDIESYYQEAGRAGRDGSPAECVLLFGKQDILLNKYLIDRSSDMPDIDEKEKEALKQKQHLRLQKMIDYCQTSGCLRRYILGYFGEISKKRCDSCSGCNGLKPLLKVRSPEQETLPNDIESAFTALRLLRNRLALEHKVPAYLIFTDSSLREMATNLPLTMESFFNISGVGKKKAQSYGEVFLSLIASLKSVLRYGPISKQDASLLANQIYENTKPWSDTELLRLRLLASQGMSAHTIATELKRSLWQVERALERIMEKKQ